MLTLLQVALNQILPSPQVRLPARGPPVSLYCLCEHCLDFNIGFNLFMPLHHPLSPSHFLLLSLLSSSASFPFSSFWPPSSFSVLFAFLLFFFILVFLRVCVPGYMDTSMERPEVGGGCLPQWLSTLVLVELINSDRVGGHPTHPQAFSCFHL